MKAIKFWGDMNNDSIKNLLLEIDKVPKDEGIVLYFVSGGGSYSEACDLADYINRYKDRFEIVCSWEMSSSALDLLLKVYCKIKLINGMFSRVHLFSNSLEYRELKNKNSIDNFLVMDCEKENDEWINKLIKCEFNNEEINRIKSGLFVCCDSKRVRHIISILNPKAILL